MGIQQVRSARNALAIVGGGVALAYVVGELSVTSMTLAVALALVPAFAALAIADAGVILAAILPATYLTYRLPVGDLSVADFTLVCGVVIAFAGVLRYGRTLTGLLRVVVAYEIVMLAVVWVSPTDAAWTEWVHRAGLMAGGLLVGAAIVKQGKLALTLRLFIGITAVFAVGAVAQSALSGFEPAYPFGTHKNAAGSLLAMALALLVTVPADAIVIRYRRALYVLLTAGLFATRSRGAIVGLGVVLLWWVLTQRHLAQKVRLLALATALAGGVFVWNSIQTELRTDTFKFGSIGTRERQHAQAWRAFEKNTVFGVGIRYYDTRTELAADGRPSSAIYEALAEGGYVGTGALALAVFGPIVVLRRGRSPWLVVGIAVYSVRAVHGVFDNFWVAGPFTMPWIIMGIAAALDIDFEDAGEAQGDSEEATPALTASS